MEIKSFQMPLDEGLKARNLQGFYLLSLPVNIQKNQECIRCNLQKWRYPLLLFLL